jgi:hypothetical protein
MVTTEEYDDDDANHPALSPFMRPSFPSPRRARSRILESGERYFEENVDEELDTSTEISYPFNQAPPPTPVKNRLQYQSFPMLDTVLEENATETSPMSPILEMLASALDTTALFTRRTKSEPSMSAVSSELDDEGYDPFELGFNSRETPIRRIASAPPLSTLPLDKFLSSGNDLDILSNPPSPLLQYSLQRSSKYMNPQYETEKQQFTDEEEDDLDDLYCLPSPILPQVDQDCVFDNLDESPNEQKVTTIASNGAEMESIVVQLDFHPQSEIPHLDIDDNRDDSYANSPVEMASEERTKPLYVDVGTQTENMVASTEMTPVVGRYSDTSTQTQNELDDSTKNWAQVAVSSQDEVSEFFYNKPKPDGLLILVGVIIFIVMVLPDS